MSDREEAAAGDGESEIVKLPIALPTLSMPLSQISNSLSSPIPSNSAEIINRPEASHSKPPDLTIPSTSPPKALFHRPSLEDRSDTSSLPHINGNYSNLPGKASHNVSQIGFTSPEVQTLESYNHKFEWYLQKVKEKTVNPNVLLGEFRGLDAPSLYESATDIYDELLRREDYARNDPESPSSPTYLPPTAMYEKERNEARADLSTFPENKLYSLVAVTSDELRSRLSWIEPSLAEREHMPPLSLLSPLPTMVSSSTSDPTRNNLDSLRRQSLSSYFTAKTRTSTMSTFHTARSSKASIIGFYADHAGSADTYVQSLSPWRQFLKSRNLIPDPLYEQDWSGRGQHAEFSPDEIPLIPVKVEKVVGFSQTALIESVRCKRIRLARKIIRCRGRIKREDAIKEVEHLQRLTHSHIVRLVGTYVVGFDFCILLYPVTEYNLETFMDIVYEERLLNLNPRDCATGTEIEVQARKLCLWYFFGCLAYAVHYIHLKATKHMDIKPKNLLVRDMRSAKTEYDLPYKIYIADFGISRVYGTALESDTDSPTPFTRAYAAPEVVAQETRGLGADIFSLGCVFIKMLATLATNNHGLDCQQILINIRTSNPYADSSFQANSIRIKEMLALAFGAPSSEIDRYFHCVREVTYSMLSTNPNSRPTSRMVKTALTQGTHPFNCRHAKQEPFEEASENLGESNYSLCTSDLPYTDDSEETARARSRAMVRRLLIDADP